MSSVKLRRKRISFAANSEIWYDPEHDRDLIVQSIAKQYGILPSAQGELPYGEWAVLVSGIMEDTPLGQTVLIRKEEDRNRLKNFTKYEHRIRNEWRSFIAQQKTERDKMRPEDYAVNFEKMFASMFK